MQSVPITTNVVSCPIDWLLNSGYYFSTFFDISWILPVKLMKYDCHDTVYSRNHPCTLNYISTFLLKYLTNFILFPIQTWPPNLNVVMICELFICYQINLLFYKVQICINLKKIILNLLVLSVAIIKIIHYTYLNENMEV
jgi:hypothetical protein